jgi:wyosine [tRNA(Phe)-imidazoG37] synthetase (radical SAM superfamily)
MNDSYQYLFGPVPSRRLGRSLGVDLVPCKTCSFNCIFCELGPTTDLTLARREYVPTDQVLAELDRWLTEGGSADYITLAGSGEPTLHSRFGEIIEHARVHSPIPVALLTNGTTMLDHSVRSAAAAANVVKVSLSAWDQASLKRINRPCAGVSLRQIVDGLELFRHKFNGSLWLEVFLVWGINSTPQEVKKIAQLARRFAPDRIHLNTAVRPPAEDFAYPVPIPLMEELAALFSPAAEVIPAFKRVAAALPPVPADRILSMLRRRPCTADDISGAFMLHPAETAKYIGVLLRGKQVKLQRRDGQIYYVAADVSGGDAAGNRRRPE